MRLPGPVRAIGGTLVRHVSVPVKAGPNRGLMWSLASAGRGYRAGRFEPDRVQALLALSRPGDRIWDIGAHKGYVALALARKVGRAGTVLAFEPSRVNLWFLRRHIEWNRIPNVRIVPVAVSDREGEDSFGGGGSSVTYRLGRGHERVRVSTLRSLAKEEGLDPPDVLKIDVEGNEAAVLRGAGDLLSQEMLLFISIHNRGAHAECRSILLQRGYRLYEERALVERAADPSRRWGGDRVLLAVGAHRSVSDAEVRSLRLFADEPSAHGRSTEDPEPYGPNREALMDRGLGTSP
jgi:FkbM family methyltransferase